MWSVSTHRPCIQDLMQLSVQVSKMQLKCVPFLMETSFFFFFFFYQEMAVTFNFNNISLTMWTDDVGDKI